MVTGWSADDDVVEAIELPGKRFALGVLWHPEEDEASGVIAALVDERAHEPGERPHDRGHRAGDRAGDGRGPARRRRGGRRRGRAREGGLPGLAGGRPGDRATAAASASPTRSRSTARSWRRSRRATPASRSATPAARSGWWSTTFRYYAGAPERLLGQTIPVAGGVDMTFREPLGVVGLIVPWNFPLVIASWKVAPALAAGNTRRPEAGRADAADRARAGADRARGRAAGGRAERRRRARAASAASGWSSTPTSPRSPSPARPRWAGGIAAGAAATIKRVTLELGGKSANVVFADADLEAAAAAAPVAVFGNAGQDCCARSRILVERSALDDFMDALERAVEAHARSATRSTRRPRWAR